MSSKRVFLTYNRKRLSTRSGLGHGNGCCDSLSNGLTDNLMTTLDKYDTRGDKHTSEDLKRNLVICLKCIVCGASDNLLQCDDCQQSYHLQCLDHSMKHINLQKQLCCDCISKRCSSTSPPVRHSSRLKAKKHIEGSDVLQMTVRSQKTLIRSPGEVTSGSYRADLSSLVISLQNKSIHFHNGSCSNVDFFSASDDGSAERRLDSQSMGIDILKSSDFIGSKSADESKCCLPCDDDSSLSKSSNLGISKEKMTNLSGDLCVQTKSHTPLITFSRRCKRKKDSDQAGARKDSSFNEKSCSLFMRWSNSAHANAPSSEATSHKGSSKDFELSGYVRDAEHVLLDKIKDVESIKDHSRPVSETMVLICADKQLHGGKTISKDDSSVAGQAPCLSSKGVMDVQNTSLNDAVKDSTSNGIIVDEKSENHEFQACVRDESQFSSSDDVNKTTVPELTRETLLPCLNQSVNPPDPCGAMGCTIDINSSPQKQPFNSESVTVLESLDSSNRSHATVSHEVSPSELIELINERVGKSPLMHHAKVGDALILVDNVGANCKNNVESFHGCSLDISKTKCLQLFSEEKSNEVSHSAISEAEATAYMVSEERNTFLLGSENNQLKQTPNRSSFLNLSLPKEPQFGGCASNNFSTTLPLLNSGVQFKDFVHDEVQQSSFNHISQLRHKMVLGSIMNRARALNGRGSFQDQFKPHSSIWSEKELDFLWIGVRRHGRDNWNAILKDPRLHFSPWRVARDLAERWEEEQFKLLNGTCVSQFKYSTAQDVSLDYNDGIFYPTAGVWKENTVDKTRLSLGDVYARRDRSVPKRPRFDFASIQNHGTDQLQKPIICPSRAPSSDFQREIYDWGSFNYMESKSIPSCDPLWNDGPFASSTARSNMPHWLREAVTAPPLKPVVAVLPQVVSSNAQSGILKIIQPNFDPSEGQFGPGNRIHDEFSALRTINLQTSTSAHHHNSSLGIRHERDDESRTLCQTNKPNELIVIESDASSEETISDEHVWRP